MPREPKKQRMWKTILKLNSEWVPAKNLAVQANVTVYEIVSFLIRARNMGIVESKTKHGIMFWRKKEERAGDVSNSISNPNL